MRFWGNPRSFGIRDAADQEGRAAFHVARWHLVAQLIILVRQGLAMVRVLVSRHFTKFRAFSFYMSLSMHLFGLSLFPRVNRVHRIQGMSHPVVSECH